MHRQFLGFREDAAAIAASKDFYKTLVGTMKTIAPLVAFLNEPLIEATRTDRKAHILSDPFSLDGRT